jgi:hypothetical protein
VAAKAGHLTEEGVNHSIAVEEDPILADAGRAKVCVRVFARGEEPICL